MPDNGAVMATPGRNMLTIANRWHWMCKPGLYLVTFAWLPFAHNVSAVVDDFGDLVAVPD